MRARKRGKRAHKRNAGGFWAWASEHWIISGFILLPTLIMLPVYVIQALRGRDGGGGTTDAKRLSGVYTGGGGQQFGAAKPNRLAAGIAPP